jgi:hypothetical protein
VALVVVEANGAIAHDPFEVQRVLSDELIPKMGRAHRLCPVVQSSSSARSSPLAVAVRMVVEDRITKGRFHILLLFSCILGGFHLGGLLL